MWGSLSGKTASMTTPWISSIRPTFLVPVSAPAGRSVVLASMVFSSPGKRFAKLGLGQRLGATDDFHDLLRDLGLPRAVHLEREVLDDLAGVLRRAAHRGHARAMLGRGRLQQRAEDRDLHVVGDQPLEDDGGIGLVLDERVVAGLAFGTLLLALAALEDRRLLQRQQRLPPQLLHQRRHVAV